MGTDVRPDPASPAPSRLSRAAWATLLWIEPGDNPAGVVYGTITVGTLLAAESPRRETFPRLAGAVVVALLLYWLAHAYSSAAGERFDGQAARWSVRQVGSMMLSEASLLRGAAAPLLALLIAWAAGADIATGAAAGVWTSAVALVAFELAHGLRSRLRPLALIAETFIGVALGAAVLVLRIVLH